MPTTGVAIVADSSISLPPALLKDLPVYTVPFEIHYQDRVYGDGIDITAADFYQMQRDGPSLPTTSAPPPGAFLDAYTKAAAHASSILCVTLADKLSATHESAMVAKAQAAESLPGVDIRVLDSQTAGTAEGLLVLEAARLADSGASIEDVQAAAEQRVHSVYLMAYLETLYYVWRGGRVPRVAMWMGRLLKIRPVLELSEGHIGMVERPRTTRLATDRLISRARERIGSSPARIAVIHAGAPEPAAALEERIRQELAPVELFISELTPVIGAHTGPGLVGCAFHSIAAREAS
ncbi:MAG: DegV family protein [Chloroflexi bacterium]|nr:DegV family protein [Chloroflexota bacterium]